MIDLSGDRAAPRVGEAVHFRLARRSEGSFALSFSPSSIGGLDTCKFAIDGMSDELMEEDLVANVSEEIPPDTGKG